MDILKSRRLAWLTTDDDLNNEGVTIDDHEPTPLDKIKLSTPVQLKTPNLVLYMFPVKYADNEERVEFPTGNKVTPLQILGAIHTYYDLPLTIEEVDSLMQKEPGARDILEEARIQLESGHEVKRSEIMSDNTFFEGLTEQPDGSFVVNLGS